MGLNRKDHWRSNLSTYLATQARTPFEYGRSDCALFASGAVDAMTGTDPAAEWRGKYTTLRGGLRVIRRAGFDDHIDATAAILAEVHPGRAQIGDIVEVPGDAGPALGVIVGEWIAVRTPTGVGYVPSTLAVRSFKCG